MKEIIDIKTFEKIVCNYSSLGYIFRGLASTKYKPLPSIFIGDTNKDIKYYENEIICNKKLFNFGKINDLNRAETLILARHFGYKCRLVDYTYNPFIALYFACCDQNYEDGQILLFNLPKYIAEVINKSGNFTHYTNDDIFDLLEDYENNGTIQINRYDIDCDETQLIFKYPLPLFCGFNEVRPSIQHGLFLMWCDLGLNNDDVLNVLDNYSETLIIPKNMKQQIIKHLEDKGYLKEKIMQDKSNYLNENRLLEFKNLIDGLNNLLYK